MKRILITGENSFIGTSVEKWLEQWSEKYHVDTISVKEDSWIKEDFFQYDVVFHVAGIAHVSANPKFEESYNKVNRDLTIAVAKKAKKDGARQFIFMSSIIVYGDQCEIVGNRVINQHTIPKPSNYYGKSKLMAEEGILPLNDDRFKVVVLRPPMIYGKGSKGNYPKLVKIARKLPVFPDINNKRSMIHVDNLSEFIRLVIDYEENGLFFPQNKEYVNTAEMVRLIAKEEGRSVKLVKMFNPLLKLFGNQVGFLNKAFGNLVYDKSISEYKVNYRVRNFQESIEYTQKD